MPTAITIPATLPTRYLGGMAALNLPSPKGTGDWHFWQTFFCERKKLSRSFISGLGCETDTVGLLGEEGVFDCSALLDSLNIPFDGERAFAASHARAVADLVLASVLRGEPTDYICLDDWMPRDSDKEEVFALLDKAMSKLGPEQQEKVMEWKEKNRED